MSDELPENILAASKAAAEHEYDTITLTREELEGMKVNNHISDSEYNMALKDGHNYAIDAILEKM